VRAPEASIGASAAAIGRTEAAIQVAGLGGILTAGLALAYTSLKVPLFCPLRAATGVPCPFCGMTTGTVAVLQGNIVAALAANPFSLAVPPLVTGGILSRLRSMFRERPRREWSPIVRKAGLSLFFSALIASWIFQLFRFDVL
jgi:hypothetical protein